MTRASLRTTAGDAAVQQTAVAAAKPAAAPAAPAVKPGVIQQRVAAPAVARVTTAPAAALAAAAPVRQVRARTTAPAMAPTTAQPNVTTTPAHKTAPALAPRAPRAAKTATIEVQAQVVTETVVTPTPVAGVTVESVNSAAPAASVEDALLGDETAAETAPVAEVEVVDAGPVAPEDQEAPAAPVTQALAPRPPASVARQMFGESDGITGDWTSDDLKFPRLQIVRGSGELSQSFNDGTLLYSDIPLLMPPSMEANAQNPVLYFSPILINKGFREVLTEEEQQSGQLPRNASTRQEVESLGGTVKWVGGQKPNWAPSSACVLIIEKPENSEHPGFVLPLDQRDYAVALFFVSGKDHGLFADLIVNTAKQVLQVPLLDGSGQPLKDEAGRVRKRILLYKNFWTLQYTRDTSGKYPTWRPTIRLSAKEETGPEVREYIENLFGNGAAATQAAE